jgi:hypothetical protein
MCLASRETPKGFRSYFNAEQPQSGAERCGAVGDKGASEVELLQLLWAMSSESSRQLAARAHGF